MKIKTINHQSIKSSYLIFFLLILNSSLAQNTVFSIETSEEQVLYRNIENVVTIQSNLSPDDYKIVFKNCDVSKNITPEHQFVLTPGKGRASSIDIIDAKDSTRLYFSKTFKVDYLPNPELYYGIANNGTKINPNAGHLFVKYPPSYNLSVLSNSFEIISWKISLGNKIFEGKGHVITEEVKKELIEIKDVQLVSILALVKGPDGLTRKIGATYSLQ